MRKKWKRKTGNITIWIFPLNFNVWEFKWIFTSNSTLWHNILSLLFRCNIAFLPKNATGFRYGKTNQWSSIHFGRFQTDWTKWTDYKRFQFEFRLISIDAKWNGKKEFDLHICLRCVVVCVCVLYVRVCYAYCGAIIKTSILWLHRLVRLILFEFNVFVLIFYFNICFLTQYFL